MCNRYIPGIASIFNFLKTQPLFKNLIIKKDPCLHGANRQGGKPKINEMITDWERAKKEMNVELKRVMGIPLKRVMKGGPLGEDDI